MTPRQRWRVASLQPCTGCHEWHRKDEAGEEWDRTHGCEGCAKLSGMTAEEFEQYGYGDTAINKDCPECKGQGTSI